MEEIRDALRKILQLPLDRAPVVHYSEDPISPRPGYWFKFLHRWAYLGDEESAALLTAQRGDWFVPARDGRLTDVIRDRYNTRHPQEPQTGDEKSRVAAIQLEIQFQDHLYKPIPPIVEYDTGESVTEDEIAAVVRETPLSLIKTKTVLLQQVVPETTADQHLSQFPLTALFQAKEGKLLTQTVFHLNSDGGWILKEQENFLMPRGTILLPLLELIIEEETRNVLNLKIYDTAGNTLLRLIGDGRGGLILDHLTLTRIP